MGVQSARFSALYGPCVLATLVVAALAFQHASAVQEDASHWRTVGREELLRALKEKRVERTARNVILFVGDGMGPSTVTAARIYAGGEAHSLSFERFPYTGLLKTYAVDKKVPDSACTATALFTGVKTNYEVAGVDANVKLKDCGASTNTDFHLSSLMKWAQDAGKSTGFVTNTRVTHATPSALYAHVADRRWECEDKMPPEATSCKDIARQLVEDEPGYNINVIMGGGRQCLQTNIMDSSADPIDTWSCRRKDNLDLIEKWAEDKIQRNLPHRVVTNTEELLSPDIKATKYLLGIFANGHLKMDHERNASLMPSLEQMTETAINILAKNPNGYILMVEGGLIDQAHHRGHARQALHETQAMDRAVKRAVEVTNMDETLIVVTSDHDQGMAFVGYAPRDENILGVAQKSKINGVPYTSLLYATGDASNYQFSAVDTNVVRTDPTTMDTTSFKYSQQTGVLTDEVTHAGTDVAVYAQGPMAHLFSGVHEQNYVAHVIAYTAKIGEYSENSGSRLNSVRTLYLLCLDLLAYFSVLKY